MENIQQTPASDDIRADCDCRAKAHLYESFEHNNVAAESTIGDCVIFCIFILSALMYCLFFAVRAHRNAIGTHTGQG